VAELLRIALVSSSPLVLAGLQAGLAQHAGFEIVQAAAQWRELQGEAADVAIVDIETPSDEAPLVHDAEAGPAIVLLAPEQAPVGDWLAAGFSVVPRHAGIASIAAAAQAAACGLVAGSAALVRGALRDASHAELRAAASDFEPLTPREHEVLAQMSRGLANREIAQALHISPHTAKFHVAQIIAKLDASSRAHAVAKGLRAGLVEL
jgi:DNA-binding NarL/FixJ family response regulator